MIKDLAKEKDKTEKELPKMSQVSKGFWEEGNYLSNLRP